jgi:hypothetical protein
VRTLKSYIHFTQRCGTTSDTAAQASTTDTCMPHVRNVMFISTAVFVTLPYPATRMLHRQFGIHEYLGSK